MTNPLASKTKQRGREGSPTMASTEHPNVCLLGRLREVQVDLHRTAASPLAVLHRILSALASFIFKMCSCLMSDLFKLIK